MPPRGARSAISHSGVAGLRARLKPERFWFNSRGWDTGRRFKVTGWCATPASVGSIPTACSKRQGAALAVAGGCVVVDTLVFQTRPPGSIPTARSIEDKDTSCALPIGGCSATASLSTSRCRCATTRPGGRRAPAPGRAVVASSTGNPGQAGRGRDDVERRSASDPDDAGTRGTVDPDRSAPPVIADFARAWSSLRAAVAKARHTATAAGVATHRYLGPKLSRLSGRLLNGWALVRTQPVPRRILTQPGQGAAAADRAPVMVRLHPLRPSPAGRRARGPPSGPWPPFHGRDTILRRSLAEVRVLPVAPIDPLGVVQEQNARFGSAGSFN